MFPLLGEGAALAALRVEPYTTPLAMHQTPQVDERVSSCTTTPSIVFCQSAFYTVWSVILCCSYKTHCTTFLIHLHINSLIHLGMGSSPLGFNRNFSSPGSLPTILDASPHFELNQEPQFTDNMPTVPVRAPFGQSKPKAIPESKGTKRYHPSEGTVVGNHSLPSFPLPADVVSNVS